MIDLDAIWTDKDTLYCEFGYLYLTGVIEYWEFQSLTDWQWLQIYLYIRPHNREPANELLLDCLYNFWKRQKRISRMYEFYGRQSAIEVNFSEQHQQRLAGLFIARQNRNRIPR